MPKALLGDEVERFFFLAGKIIMVMYGFARISVQDGIYRHAFVSGASNSTSVSRLRRLPTTEIIIDGSAVLPGMAPFFNNFQVSMMNDSRCFKILDVESDQRLVLGDEVSVRSFEGNGEVRLDDERTLRAEEVVFILPRRFVDCTPSSVRVALEDLPPRDRHDTANIPERPDNGYHFRVEDREDNENVNPNTAVVNDTSMKRSKLLKKQLEQSETSLHAALAQADNKEEVAPLKAKIAELEASLQAAAASKAQVQKIQAELAAAKKAPVVDEKLAELRVDAAQAAKAASAQRITELQAELAAEKQDAAQASAELVTLTFELDALQPGFIEKENLAQANNTFAEERKQHLAEIEDLQNQNTNKDGTITNDCREHLAEVEEVKKALATSKEAELSLTARLDVLGKKLAESDEYTHNSKSKIHELQNEIKSMERENDALKQQLREERERVEQFEKVETVAPVTSAPPAEDSATKELIEKLEKELEAAQKKVAELEAAQKESPAQTPAIEQEIVELKAKKNELAETNVKLAAAVRDAEAKAKQIEADATAANAITLKMVVDTLGEALSSAGIKTNPNVPSSVDGLQKWIQSVAGAVKKATAKPKEPNPVPEAAKPTTSSVDSEEVEQLKEKVADYEDRLANVAKHIEAIEGAYHEYKHEQEKKLAALQMRK